MTAGERAWGDKQTLDGLEQEEEEPDVSGEKAGRIAKLAVARVARAARVLGNHLRY